MKTIVDQLARAAKTLSDATEKALESAEKEARIQAKRPDRRRADRRIRVHVHEVIVLREELEDIKLRVTHNARQLEIQFARLAEMQVEIDRLTGKKPPRFKG